MGNVHVKYMVYLIYITLKIYFNYVNQTVCLSLIFNNGLKGNYLNTVKGSLELKNSCRTFRALKYMENISFTAPVNIIFQHKAMKSDFQ